jgi:hypothetical protein
VVAAVADGHGSARHDRSHIGAQIAVQGAVTAFQTFLLDHHEVERKSLVTDFKRCFPTEVTREWRRAVQDYCTKCQEAAAPDYGRYGTTLLVAGMVDRYLFLAQVGDGDIVVTAYQDQHQEQPLAVNDGLVAGETFSLCSQDAEKLWRTTTRDLADVAFVTLSTDGLRNSYASTDAFLRLLAAVRQNIRQCGIGRAAAILPENLDRFSAQGSGDDITLVGMMVGELPKTAIPEPIAVSSELAAVAAPDAAATEKPEVPNREAAVPAYLPPAPDPTPHASLESVPEPQTDAAGSPASGHIHEVA